MHAFVFVCVCNMRLCNISCRRIKEESGRPARRLVSWEGYRDQNFKKCMCQRDIVLGQLSAFLIQKMEDNNAYLAVLL